MFTVCQIYVSSQQKWRLQNKNVLEVEEKTLLTICKSQIVRSFLFSIYLLCSLFRTEIGFIFVSTWGLRPTGKLILKLL